VTARVVTDSSAVIPTEWRDGIPLHIVSLQLAWASGDVSAGDAPYAELVARLQKGERPPKTAAPSPGAYEELYRELLATDDAVLVVCPASELSTTYSSAVLAARSVGEDRVYVLDAKTAAAGQGLVAVEAARLAADGGDIERVLARALDVAGHVQIWATLSQLEFLRRSGRLPAIAAIGAGALGLQPIVRYGGGSPTPVGVTRNAQRGADRLFRAWQRSIVAAAKATVVAFHSAREGDARDLQRRVLERAPGAETAVTEVTASLASHTGPGLLGLAWLWQPLHS
jgi:DegV family protein with EDD domain